MHAIHPDARTTPAVRVEIARSVEPTGVLARRFGVSTETIRKWRKRGPDVCQDRSARPHKVPWKASEEERAIVCALRRATASPLDDLTFVVTHFLPHLNCDASRRARPLPWLWQASQLMRSQSQAEIDLRSRPEELSHQMQFEYSDIDLLILKLVVISIASEP